MSKREVIKNARKKSTGGQAASGTRKKTPTGKAPPAGSRCHTMRIERVEVKKITVATYNPRKDLQPGDPEYATLERSLDEFGLVEPLVWNKRSGNLVGGHQRLKVLQNRGVKEVEVSVVDLTPARERALNVALNKIAGEWDDLALSELLLELQGTDEVDETVTGFDPDEITDQIALMTARMEEADQPAGEEVAQLGNSFKVVAECTDAKQQAEVVKTLRQKRVACHTLTRE